MAMVRRFLMRDGSVKDVPYPAELGAWAQGPVTALMWVGTTADRPLNNPNMVGWPPATMFDTTLGKPIFLVPNTNPAAWIDINGNPV
jgi:hypothetical protein